MANELVGAWRLESWTAHDEDGAVLHPLGEHATGLVIITADSWLSAQLMGKEPVQVAPDRAVTYLGYAGPYQVVGDQVVTTVEISSIPDWVGTEQVRDVALVGDTVVFRPPPVGGVQHELQWRRIT
jgi:Lipocalin-like domain